MARISPPDRATQFFGLYGLSGSITAFLAPLLVATTTQWSASQRWGFASLFVLILFGGLMLFWVEEKQASAPEPPEEIVYVNRARVSSMYGGRCKRRLSECCQCN